MSEKRLFVRVRGKIMGPFGTAQLRALRDRGQFRSFHEVSEDRQVWGSAADLTDFFAAELTERPIAAATVEPRQSAKPSPAARSGGWHYVDLSAQERGPVDGDQLLALKRGGSIHDGTMVWREGMDAWKPLSAAGALPPTLSAGGKEQPMGLLDALPVFVCDPVGGLPKLCASLNPLAASVLGVLFYVIAVVGAFLGLALAGEFEGVSVFRDWRSMPRSGMRAEIMLRLMASSVIPFISMAGAILLIRLITRSRGNFSTDTLTAGATTFHVGLSIPIFALVGSNYEIIAFLLVLVMSLPVMILYGSFTRWMGLPDAGAIFAVPAALVVSLWISKAIWVALVQRPLADIVPFGILRTQFDSIF